eukprot:SAG31_NODE_3079_length_4706_cov_3.887779_1_plen_134_part_00
MATEGGAAAAASASDGDDVEDAVEHIIQDREAAMLQRRLEQGHQVGVAGGMFNLQLRWPLGRQVPELTNYGRENRVQKKRNVNDEEGGGRSVTVNRLASFVAADQPTHEAMVQRSFGVQRNNYNLLLCGAPSS